MLSTLLSHMTYLYIDNSSVSCFGFYTGTYHLFHMLKYKSVRRLKVHCLSGFHCTFKCSKWGLWVRTTLSFQQLLFFPQYHMRSDLDFQTSKYSTENIFILQRWSAPTFFIPGWGIISTFATWAAKQGLCSSIPMQSPGPLVKCSWGKAARDFCGCKEALCAFLCAINGKHGENKGDNAHIPSSSVKDGSVSQNIFCVCISQKAAQTEPDIPWAKIWTWQD